MKASILRFPLFIAFLAFGLFSCSDDDGTPTLDPQQERTQQLSGTWNTVSFTQPAGLTSDYSNLVISITGNVNQEGGGGSFTTQNGSPIFAPSGTWAFEGTSTNAIGVQQNADANIRVLINSITETTLTIEVEATDPSARVTSIFGNYTFNMQKQ